jgi:hypothetical protein
MIVVEGADNSGKSVFAKSFGLAYFSAGPAPNDSKELAKCLREQRNRVLLPCVQDRLTCISQQVYSDAPESALLQTDLEAIVEEPRVIVVYCRPPERTLMDLSTHVVKSYDTEENMEKIARRQHEYIKRYDDLMATIPHVIYDWTDHDDLTNSQIRSMLVMTQHSTDEWRNLRETMKMGRISF